MVVVVAAVEVAAMEVASVGRPPKKPKETQVHAMRENEKFFNPQIIQRMWTAIREKKSKKTN